MIISEMFRSNLSPADFLSGVLEVGEETTSGERVSAETSKNVATAYRCIDVLSSDIAKLPLQVFSSPAQGNIQRVKPSSQQQNIAWMTERKPNRWMGPFKFKKMVVGWQLTHGAGYIWQPPRRAGNPREMFVLPSDRTFPIFDESGNLWYQTTFASGETVMLPDVEVLTLLINSVDGISGRGVITYARETLGRQLGGYKTQGKIYRQGLSAGGIIWMSGELNKDARKKVREAYAESMTGSENAYGLAVMDSKVSKFEQITLKAVDMQFLESLQENDTQIANFFGVPLYKLNLGKQSYQSNEQQNIDYLNTTLDPYLVQWEEEAYLKWLTEVEQDTVYFRFNRDALLRMTAESRANTLGKRIETGQLSPNEARQIEDMSAYTGGDTRYRPSNWTPIGAQAPTV